MPALPSSPRAVLALSVALLLGPTPARAGPPSGPSLASCERAVAEDPGEREAWGCFYDHARSAGDWSASEERLRATLRDTPAAQAEGGALARGYALLTLGNLVGERDNAEAIGIYEQAVELFERGGDELALTLTRLNLAYRHRVAGAPERSAEVLRAAEQSAARHGEARWIATVKVERVRHTTRSGGDLGEAAKILAEAEPLIFPEGDYQAKVNWLNAASAVERGLGRLAGARAAHDRLVTLSREAGDGYTEAAARYNRLLARIEAAGRRGQERPEPEMIAEVEASLEVAEAGGNLWARAAMRCLHADFLRARDDAPASRAEAIARRCVAESRALEDPRLIAEALISLAYVLLAEPAGGRDPGTVEEIEALLEEAESVARASGDAFAELDASAARADFAWQTQARARAIAASEASLGLVDELRRSQSDASSRAELQGARADCFERYVGHLLRAAASEDEPGARREAIAAAFAVSERFRAQVLLESLHAAGLREDEGEDDGEEALAPVLPLAELQAALEPGEALLSFQLATERDLFDSTFNGGSWVFVVSRDAATALPLPAADELEARLELFAPLLARRDADPDEAAAGLWRLLLAEALAELPASVDTLFVVPDGALHRLPFASLRPAPGAPSLGSRYALSLVPSASALGLWRASRRGRDRPTRLLALADPPAPTQLDDPLAFRGPSSAKLPALPRARREAALAVVAPESAGGDTLWLGAEASEAALLAHALDDYGVLHLATHALVDDRHPERSAIVLAGPKAETDAQADGLLRPAEIAELELAGKLVVLSACSSADGRLIEGEGIMGLAHALFQAGAHAVVGSLWPLRDDEALALFERFYLHLDGGSSVAEALAAAQRDRIAAGAPPSAWAGVVVLGDGALVPFPGGRERPARDEREQSPRWLALVVAALAVLAGLAVGLRRRR